MKNVAAMDVNARLTSAAPSMSIVFELAFRRDVIVFLGLSLVTMQREW